MTLSTTETAKTEQPSVLDLWNEGLDTFEIGLRLMVPEAAAYNSLRRQREAEYAANLKREKRLLSHEDRQSEGSEMNETMSRAQYQAETAKKKRGNKYGAKRTVVDGINFDSKRESAVYSALKLLEKSGKISGLERQRKFNLIVNGEIIGTYRADFAFIDHDQDGRLRVVDVKGVVSREFTRTQKHVKALYGIDVEVWR